MATRTDIVAFARGCIGTPFLHRGRLPGVGIDCLGIVICAARAFGLVASDFDVGPYPQVPDGVEFMKGANQYMTRVSKEYMQPGDVLLMITYRFPQHMGILADYRHGGFSLIHAANSLRPPRVVETRLIFTQQQQPVAVYAIPGIDA
jgi:cell wall-associated NlpC family hydrolase